ncbi:MAG: hypothetical protein OXC72_06130 [Roseovarius sp.]|nr:hypothetical protein [Roseovarius sp.]
MTNSFRRHLSMPETMREHFDGIPDPIRTRGGEDPVMARNLHVFGVARPTVVSIRTVLHHHG